MQQTEEDKDVVREMKLGYQEEAVELQQKLEGALVDLDKASCDILALQGLQSAADSYKEETEALQGELAAARSEAEAQSGEVAAAREEVAALKGEKHRLEKVRAEETASQEQQEKIW